LGGEGALALRAEIALNECRRALLTLLALPREVSVRAGNRPDPLVWLEGDDARLRVSLSGQSRRGREPECGKQHSEGDETSSHSKRLHVEAGRVGRTTVGDSAPARYIFGRPPPSARMLQTAFS